MVTFGTIHGWDPGIGSVISWHATPTACAKARQAPISVLRASYQQTQHLREFCEFATDELIWRRRSVGVWGELVGAIDGPARHRTMAVNERSLRQAAVAPRLERHPDDIRSGNRLSAILGVSVLVSAMFVADMPRGLRASELSLPVRLTAGDVALIMGGSGVPTPTQQYADTAADLYLRPNGFATPALPTNPEPFADWRLVRCPWICRSASGDPAGDRGRGRVRPRSCRSVPPAQRTRRHSRGTDHP